MALVLPDKHTIPAYHRFSRSVTNDCFSKHQPAPYNSISRRRYSRILQYYAFLPTLLMTNCDLMNFYYLCREMRRYFLVKSILIKYTWLVGILPVSRSGLFIFLFYFQSKCTTRVSPWGISREIYNICMFDVVYISSWQIDINTTTVWRRTDIFNKRGASLKMCL